MEDVVFENVDLNDVPYLESQLRTEEDEDDYESDMAA